MMQSAQGQIVTQTTQQQGGLIFQLIESRKSATAVDAISFTVLLRNNLLSDSYLCGLLLTSA